MFNYNLIDTLISGTTSLIMLGIGLSLTFNDFKYTFKKANSIILGLISQMVVLPLIAFIICRFAPISPEFKTGLIILSASPGGATSGFLTYLLKANIALSISLTVTNSFLTLITIPIIVTFGLNYFIGQSLVIELPILKTILQIFMAVIIPTLIGIIIRFFYISFAIKFERKLKFLMIFLLLIVFSIKFFANEHVGGVNFHIEDFLSLLPFLIIFNFSCLLFGYYFLKLNNLDHTKSLTVAIESSVHNVPLALLVAGTIIGNSEMTKPVLIYGLFSFWTSLIFGFILNKIYISKI